jgi:hypothetical protein
MSPELRIEATSDLSWLLILEGATLMVEGPAIACIED